MSSIVSLENERQSRTSGRGRSSMVRGLRQRRTSHFGTAEPQKPTRRSKMLEVSRSKVEQRLPPETTGTIRASRRGIYYASELLHQPDALSYSEEIKSQEHVCIIRFPSSIAALLRQRLLTHQARLEADGLDISEFNEASDLLNSNEIGLTITPTSKEDYRLFEISVEQTLGQPSSAIQMTGLLVELPCIIEAYKSLDGNLLFKANDISQMIYVVQCDTSDYQDSLNISKIRDSQLWEWHSGLTPGTHRIRHRRFKNFNVFERSTIAAVEREICKIMNMKDVYGLPVLEASTEYVLEEQLCSLDDLSKVSGNEQVTAVIGPENPILYAAVHGVIPKVASQQFEDFAQEELQSLLRRHTRRNQKSEVTPQSLFKFCSNQDLTYDDEIPDHLSDILFDELPTVVDSAQEAAQLKDEIKNLTYATQKISDEASDASLSSEEETRQNRRYRKKTKHQAFK